MPSPVTEYMCIVASAEEVASTDPSGENLRQVMPRAWALGNVNSGANRSCFFFGVIGEVWPIERDREAFREDGCDVSLEWALPLRGDDRLRMGPSSSSLDLLSSGVLFLLRECEYLREFPCLSLSASPVARRIGSVWPVRGACLLVSGSDDDCLDRDESRLSVRRRLGEGSGMSASLFMVSVGTLHFLCLAPFPACENL